MKKEQNKYCNKIPGYSILTNANLTWYYRFCIRISFKFLVSIVLKIRLYRRKKPAPSTNTDRMDSGSGHALA